MKHRYTRCHARLIAALVAAREAAGLSQRDLSARLRRSDTFVHYVERGQRILSYCEVLEYVRACGADPAQILKQIA